MTWERGSRYLSFQLFIIHHFAIFVTNYTYMGLVEIGDMNFVSRFSNYDNGPLKQYCGVTLLAFEYRCFFEKQL